MGDRPRLEDYMKIVNDSHTKTASAKSNEINGDLLQKLAQEMAGEAGESKVVPTSSAAPAAAAGAASAEAQGNVKPAESSVVAANPAVDAATAAVQDPQLEAVGPGSTAEQAAGEQAAPVKPNEGVVISPSDGTATDANQLNKEPIAVAAAAEPTNKESSVEKTAELQRAEEIGKTMARSYVSELEKVAEDNKYNEALSYLKDRGMLEGYDVTE